MQYIRIGKLKIPYEVKFTEHKKYLKILGVKVPFSTDKDLYGQKYYRIFGIRFKIKSRDKFIISRSRFNFENNKKWTDEDIKKASEQIFKQKLGYTPNLDMPKSMNEKIFWLKLNYHNPLVTKCCDKFRVKEYVAEKIGTKFSVPVIDSWKSAEEIDFSKLPEQFVLKVNWSSGYNIIVKNKQELNEEKAREKIKYWLQPEQNSYYQAFNWGYKDMEPIVYAEEYIEQLDGQLFDYKIYCCNGKARFMFISTDRYNGDGVTYDFFDMNFEKLDFHYGRREHSKYKLEKPHFFEDMVRYAEILSKPFPFVRVDFYELVDKLYVGEMTFYSGGGILPFEPVEWDYKLGEYINLPLKEG